jgi:hypothetical protein
MSTDLTTPASLFTRCATVFFISCMLHTHRIPVVYQSCPIILILLLCDGFFLDPYRTHCSGLLCRHIVLPVAKRCGLSVRTRATPEANASLEALYTDSKGKPSEQQVNSVATMIGKSTQYIQLWIRARRAVNKPTRTEKLSEAMWRLLLFVCTTIFAHLTITDKAWFKDTTLCWVSTS